MTTAGYIILAATIGAVLAVLVARRLRVARVATHCSCCLGETCDWCNGDLCHDCGKRSMCCRCQNSDA